MCSASLDMRCYFPVSTSGMERGGGEGGGAGDGGEEGGGAGVGVGLTEVQVD